MAAPIQNIGQIAIRARDLPAAVAFYRDVLGLDYLFEAGTLAFFMCGDVRLMLGVPENDAVDHESSTVYFRVPDLQAAYEELSERGARFVDEPHLIAELPDHELWMAFFRDPDGNLMAPHERGQTELRTAVSSSPRSSGTVTLTRVESAWRAAEYGWSSSWESTLSAITSAPGSTLSRASPNSAS